MFAILYATLTAAAKGIIAVKDSIFDTKARNNGYTNEKVGYFDHNGAYRSVKTNEQIYHTIEKNGDRVIKTIDGEVIKNYTEPFYNEQIIKKNEELENSDSPVRYLGEMCKVYPDYNKNKLWKYIGSRDAVFESQKTHKHYLRKRCIVPNCPKYVYVDLMNGEYVFLDDHGEDAEKWLDKENELEKKVGCGWISGNFEV